MRKIKMVRIPQLKIHNYVLGVGYWSKKENEGWREKYFYLKNLREVAAMKRKYGRKSVGITIFKATHKFLSRWVHDGK